MALSVRQTAVIGLTILFSVVLVWRASPYLRVYNVQPGDRAPGFELTAPDGSGVSLSDYRGKWVLLNFWATWCPPCIQEMPSLDRLHQEFEDRGLVVLGVSVDTEKQAYERFIERWNLSFPIVRDPEMSVPSRYGTNKYPETFLINPEGKVVRKYVGPENWMNPEIVNYLRSLL
jgi:cytochrome c biogenesis protein CcmG, thiol:disulfide interchange protein DsbE